MKKALICGISGQDGAYLAQHLLSRGYEVFGTSRDAQTTGFGNLQALGIRERIKALSIFTKPGASGERRLLESARRNGKPDFKLREK